MSATRAVRSSALTVLSGSSANRRLLILTFHRVLEQPDPLLPDEPTAAIFEGQISAIAAMLNVLPLPDAARMVATGRLPPRAACITFDDGYRNNYEIALPILAKHGVPATFFIATGALADGVMWNDLIVESIRRCGDRFDLREFGFADYPIGSPADRTEVTGRALLSMKYTPVDERADLARRIYRRYCGGETPSLMMDPAMVRSLAERGFDIGGHTVHHPILQEIPDDRAFAEIRDGRDWLSSVTGRPITTFAYPNGHPGIDFSAKHCAMVREAGFDCAVSTQWGCASRSSDTMALPRVTMSESTPSSVFVRLLKTYALSYRHATPAA